MTNYQVLQKKPGKLMLLTGYTPEEFSALVPYFSKRFLGFVETKL